jgi:hypothetical protein
MAATVESRLVGGDLAQLMGEMRVWLDRQKVAPHAFHQSPCPDGLALRVEFSEIHDAAEFAGRFGGRVVGAPSSPVA